MLNDITLINMWNEGIHLRLRGSPLFTEGGGAKHLEK